MHWEVTVAIPYCSMIEVITYLTSDSWSSSACTKLSLENWFEQAYNDGARAKMIMMMRPSLWSTISIHCTMILICWALKDTDFAHYLPDGK